MFALIMMHLLPMPHRSRFNSQKGSALIMVLFVIVVLGSLAIFGLRNVERSSDALMYEVIGTRADMAARSGAQLDISALYQTEGQGSCQTGIAQTYTFSGEGLNRCRAEVSCVVLGINKTDQKIYRLESEGFCSVGTQAIKRVIEVGLIGGVEDEG